MCAITRAHNWRPKYRSAICVESLEPQAIVDERKEGKKVGKSKMEFEKTPIKNNIKAAAKAEAQAVLATQSTGSMVWHLVKRHKFGLVATYAIWMTAIYAVPALPTIISSLLRSN